MDWQNFFKFNSVKNISLIGFANIFGNAISALFWIYLADLLGSNNYGEISYLMGVGSIATAIALFGSEQAIIVYSAKKINIQPPIYIISLISTGITAIIVYVIFNNFGLSIFVIGYVLFSLSLSETLGRKLYKNYSIKYFLQKVFFVTLALLFYFLIGPEGILIGYGISMLLFIRRIYDSIRYSKINFKILKSKSRFIINNYILDMTNASKGQIDKLLIAPLFGFSVLGNYFLALQVVSILSIIPGIITKYTLPEDSSGNSTLKLKIMTCLFSVILSLIGIFIAPSVIETFFPKYTESLIFLPMISVTVIPSTISSLYVSKFLALEKSNYVVIGYIISFMVSIVGILSLGSIWEYEGLAISLILSTTSQALFFIFTDIFKNNSLKKIPKL